MVWITQQGNIAQTTERKQYEQVERALDARPYNEGLASQTEVGGRACREVTPSIPGRGDHGRYSSDSVPAGKDWNRTIVTNQIGGNNVQQQRKTSDRAGAGSI